MAKLSELDIEEKIKVINSSINRKDCPYEVFPPVAPLDVPYYFISYSHLDYKLVYKDIFALQKEGVACFYDRDEGFPCGQEWPEIVEQYVKPYNCKGVIFYVSENSLRADSVKRELETIDGTKKEFLPIELPLGNRYGHESGKDDLSIEEYCNRIRAQIEAPSDLKKFDCIREIMVKHCPKEVVFCPLHETSEIKARKILGTLKGDPLLKTEGAVKLGMGIALEIVSVNDKTVKCISIDDFRRQDLEQECMRLKKKRAWARWRTAYHIDRTSLRSKRCKQEDEKIEAKLFSINHVGDFYSSLISIGFAAFAICENLQSVQLPKEVVEIPDAAFFSCKHLEEINVNSVQYVGTFAFTNCQSLGALNFSNLETMEAEAFRHSAIKYIRLVKSFEFGKEVFKCCTIHTLDLSECLFDSFELCKLLDGDSTFERVIFPTALTHLKTFMKEKFCIKKIEFARSSQLQEIDLLSWLLYAGGSEIILPPSLNKIKGPFQWYIIGREIQMGSITFLGTKEQWEQIEKDKSWERVPVKYMDGSTL